MDWPEAMRAHASTSYVLAFVPAITSRYEATFTAGFLDMRDGDHRFIPRRSSGCTAVLLDQYRGPKHDVPLGCSKITAVLVGMHRGMRRRVPRRPSTSTW
jgi:hypothetical protein